MTAVEVGSLIGKPLIVTEEPGMPQPWMRGCTKMNIPFKKLSSSLDDLGCKGKEKA